MFSRERISELKDLEDILGYNFRDVYLLNKSLTHKSYANETGEGVKDNERLEFLGDAVLDLVISDYFFKKYPFYDEGELTKIRSSLVNETTLAYVAKKLKLGEFLLLGRGEEMSGGRDKFSILANTFEAVLAAIYLDSNIDNAYLKTLDYLCEYIDKIIPGNITFVDYKSRLQEFAQQKLNCTPSYQIIKEGGPDHFKLFEVSVFMNAKEEGRGRGGSKKEAEHDAARDAIERLTGKG